jgi:signal transduction histidine kinase
MARWGSRAVDGAIVSGLALTFVFAARPRSNSLVRGAGVAFIAAAGARLFAHRGDAFKAGNGASAIDTKSTLVSIVAHEIRAPLAAIRGAVALLDEHDATLAASRRAELMHVALDATKQLGYLVDDLLLISRIAGGRLLVERSAIDLAAVVHDAANAEINRVIEVVAQDGLPSVRGDAMRVRQVVTNLLSNAVASATESSIVLASITRHDDGVRVTIYNEGRGIPPEEQSRLFLPFASLSERRVDSTGLGLYIAKELVEAMGGTIGFDTQPGHSAAFWFTLKAAVTDDPPAHPTSH